MSFACPKCRGGNLFIYEHFEAVDVIRVEGGEVVFRGTDGGSSTGKFSARCECGHQWYPRSMTGNRAVDAAMSLESK